MHTNILFLHYLPKNWFDKILHLFNKSWASGSYMSLLCENDLKKMERSLNVNRSDNISILIKKERLFGFTYQLIGMIKR